MADIVERLREERQRQDQAPHDIFIRLQPELLSEAADEIERLRLACSALTKIVYDDWPADMEMSFIAQSIMSPPSAEEQAALATLNDAPQQAS